MLPIFLILIQSPHKILQVKCALACNTKIFYYLQNISMVSIFVILFILLNTFQLVTVYFIGKLKVQLKWLEPIMFDPTCHILAGAHHAVAELLQAVQNLTIIISTTPWPVLASNMSCAIYFISLVMLFGVANGLFFQYWAFTRSTFCKSLFKGL